MRQSERTYLPKAPQRKPRRSCSQYPYTNRQFRAPTPQPANPSTIFSHCLPPIVTPLKLISMLFVGGRIVAMASATTRAAGGTGRVDRLEIKDGCPAGKKCSRTEAGSPFHNITQDRSYKIEGENRRSALSDDDQIGEHRDDQPAVPLWLDTRIELADPRRSPRSPSGSSGDPPTAMQPDRSVTRTSCPSYCTPAHKTEGQGMNPMDDEDRQMQPGSRSATNAEADRERDRRHFVPCVYDPFDEPGSREARQPAAPAGERGKTESASAIVSRV